MCCFTVEFLCAVYFYFLKSVIADDVPGGAGEKNSCASELLWCLKQELNTDISEVSTIKHEPVLFQICTVAY